MNLKSLILGLLAIGLSASTFAQTFEVETARTEYGKYIGLKGSPSLAKAPMKAAKEAIDKAVVHKKTSTDPQAWTYKALIYAELAVSDSANASSQVSLMTEAAQAAQKAKELDAAGANKKNIETANQILYSIQVNRAIKLFNSKNYTEAYPAFVKGLEYAPGDTISTYYAAASAQNAKDYPNAIKQYNALLGSNFSYLPDVYASLAEIHAATKDTASAVKILTEGAAKFPKNTALGERAIQLGLASGKASVMIPQIEAQIASNPTSKTLPFYLGLAYASSNNVPKAEAAYKKAIEIDPNFEDAYINLGSLIMNNGIDVYNTANKQYSGKKLTPAQLAEYNKVKNKATAEFDRALPFLEKAAQLNPKSKLALNNLRYYYNVKSNKTKVAELDAKIKAL
jgi:tetratricopeptide (TPR) repeat protein